MKAAELNLQPLLSIPSSDASIRSTTGISKQSELLNMAVINSTD